jgi:hypothetical protein
MENQTLWKKGLMLLGCLEVFFLLIGTLVHEITHSIQFFCLYGRFGEMHFFDTVAYSYHTIAVTLPPQGLVILDTALFEVIAYGVQFLITGCFAVLLFKKYYSSSDVDERARKSPTSPTR